MNDDRLLLKLRSWLQEEDVPSSDAEQAGVQVAARPDGSVTEEPAWLMSTRDVALLIDRLQVLFDRQAHISEGRDLSVTSELPIDALQQLVELTRGRAEPPTSPLPRAPRRLDD